MADHYSPICLATLFCESAKHSHTTPISIYPSTIMDPQSSRTVIRSRRRQPMPGQASASTGHETNPHAGTGQNESGVFSVAAAAPAALSANSAGASQNSQGHDSHNEANNGVNRARYRLGLNADSSNPVSEGDLAIRAVERGLGMHSLLSFSLNIRVIDNQSSSSIRY